MADKPSAGRKVRVTFLEPVRALDPSPEELATRVVGSAFKEHVTFLEPVRASDPSPEVPPTMRNMLAQLAAALDALEPDARAATLAELKRLAG